MRDTRSQSRQARIRLAAAVAPLALCLVLGFAPERARAQAPTELFLSEYVEGSSFNKALEIFNGTGAAIDLALGSYDVQIFFNGNSSAGATIGLTGVVASGDVFVLANPSASGPVLAVADQTSGSLSFNGDDAVVLRKAGAVVDSLGRVGEDPGSEWSGGGIGTQNQTLRRKPDVCAGDADATDPFDPSVEWDGFPNDTFDGLGSHTTTCDAPPAGSWIINEVHADPDATSGDANGDGTVSTTQDEFVELVNDTGGSVDISGWTLSDGAGLRHTFPAGTVVPNRCSVVVFGGGAPTGGFGGSEAQTASTGSLGLNNSGDDVKLNDGASDVATASYGSEGGDNQSLTLDPDVTGLPPRVRHTTATGSGGALFSPGTLIDGTAFAGCPTLPEPPGPPTLLLSEIVVTPTEGEFIEIHNPTGAILDLTDVYLTDATFAGGGVYYYNIVTGANAGGGGFGDFHARFPTASTIEPGEYLTVALAGSDDFFAQYGIPPDFELYEDGAGPDAVPDMLEALPGSINNQGGLSNSGEVVILYAWNGATDLVQDLDYALWGDKAEAVDKTGVAIDGPDGDGDASTYLPDTSIGAQSVIDTGGHAFGFAFHRLDFDEGVETKSGGNGATGHDETSENLIDTWRERLPSPGSAPPEPPPVQLLLTELVVTPTAGEFIEIHNPTLEEVELGGYYLTDATFAPGGVFYYNIVTGANAGGGGFGDFHARFPDTATIGPGEHKTVSLPGSDDYFATYGVLPDFELFEDGGGPDAVPDMVEALPGSINGQGGLSNSGEVVILYQWDGVSDLVTDIDYALWGDKAEAVDKTGVSIDGPDSGTDPSTYLDDTPIPSQDVISGGGHAAGESFQRVDPTEGMETQSGGNGVGGNDETSEDLSNTWGEDTSTPGEGQPSVWVINEIHADPASNSNCSAFGLPDECGDANGDGTRDSSDDEFVEIVNSSGASRDISGWTLSDGANLRHTFPAGTQVADGCAIVVFGDGPLIGIFGNVVVQEASSGALGLNNGGDTLTLRTDLGTLVSQVSYGAEGGDNQSLTRNPDVTGDFVRHTDAAPGVLFSPGTLSDGSAFPGCAPPPLLEVYQIQGSGLSSPFENQLVVTDDNVVTCVGTDGFFMQTPEARSDGDVDTSDGIFVFTGGPPPVAEGDLVDVIGRVNEFFGMTELSALVSLTVVGGGVVPPPVTFDAMVPSPDPAAPSCAIEYECYEGMIAEIVGGRVTGPNQRFGVDPIAEVHIVSGPDRAFRETGIEFPGLPGLPVWDGNPEVFELDPDKLGLSNQIIPAGSSFDARGAIGFEFGGYELWPNELTIYPASLPRPVRSREADEFTVGSLNMFRFFDDVDDPPSFNFMGEERDDFVVDTAEYLRRQTKFVAYILGVLDAPDILAVQEVEKLEVLEQLADAIELTDPSVVYTAYLLEGNDVGTIDVGFLVRDTVAVGGVTQLGLEETYFNSVSGMDEVLNDRPPLLLEGEKLDFGASFPLAVIVVHQRSLGGIDDPVQGPRVRDKRLQQATSLAEKVQAIQEGDPFARVMVIGDFNGFEFTDGYVDVVGEVKGDVDPEENLLSSGEDIVEPDLTNRIDLLAAEERYSFIFRGSAQTLDHALTSDGLEGYVVDAEFGRGNADAAVDLINDDATVLRSSDHDGLVVYLDDSPRKRKEKALDLLSALESTGIHDIDHRIEKAVSSIEKSLRPDRWLDGRHLDPEEGKKVFDDEKKAVKELMKVPLGLEPEVDAAVIEAISLLLEADGVLAQTAIAEAIAAAEAAGCPLGSSDPMCREALKEIEKALREIGKAEAEIADGDFDKAVSHYRKAWERALEAIDKLP